MPSYGSYREAQRAEKEKESEREAEEQDEAESEDGPGQKATQGKSATGQSTPADPHRRDPEKVFSFGGDDDPAPTPPRADRPADSDTDSGNSNTDSGSFAKDAGGSPEDTESSFKEEEPMPVSRAQTEAQEPNTRPAGEYHDGDSYTIVSRDSNGNRHITRYTGRAGRESTVRRQLPGRTGCSKAGRQHHRTFLRASGVESRHRYAGS